MTIDITTRDTSDFPAQLDWVGMRGIEIPLQIAGTQVPATTDIFVNLKDETRKGIHMSRLYLIAKQYIEGSPVTGSTLEKVLTECVSSHEGLSDQARLALHFNYVRAVDSLVSANHGWRYYPVTLNACHQNGQCRFEIAFTVTYSSTCPCSAALSRESLQQHFEQSFPEASISREAVSQWLLEAKNQAATPHSQRSQAIIKVEVEAFDSLSQIEELITVAETALQTAVQAVVKRPDEQKFAELNAANLMFCEDAARRLQHAFEPRTDLTDYRIEVQHLESLHAHDAVAVVTKRC